MEFIGSSKLTEKFQATIPKSIRGILKLDAGDLLVFVRDHDQIVIKRGKVKID